MPRGEIVQYKNPNDICKVVRMFKPWLHSLSSGVVDINEISNKFAERAIVKCVELNKRLIGFAAFYCNDTVGYTAYLSMFAVLPEFQGKGISQLLMDEIIACAKEHQMKRVSLEVRTANARAIRFYQKNGFSINEQRSNDSIIMSVEI